MSISTAENIGPMERAARLVVAALMVGAVKMYPDIVPPWVALLAAYPFATGLLSWEPLYAVYHGVTKAMSNDKVSMPGRSTA